MIVEVEQKETQFQTAATAHLTVDGTGQTDNLDMVNNPFYREFVDTILPTEQAFNFQITKARDGRGILREAVSLSPILASQLAL